MADPTEAINTLALRLGNLLVAHGLRLATAESCTGGGLAFALTSVTGSSAWFERGFVTYSNQAKEEMLGVKPRTLVISGAVSEQTAREMAEGILKNSPADIGMAITGIAGPGGGTVDKPVGTVWFGWKARAENTQALVKIFDGSRASVRAQSIQTALQTLVEFVETV